MSGAHRAALREVSAHDGLVGIASATKSQSTRFVERAMGRTCAVPSPSRSGSEVPNAYHVPSLPRMTEGSAKVSAKSAETGFSYVGAPPARALVTEAGPAWALVTGPGPAWAAGTASAATAVAAA